MHVPRGLVAQAYVDSLQDALDGIVQDAYLLCGPAAYGNTLESNGSVLLQERSHESLETGKLCPEPLIYEEAICQLRYVPQQRPLARDHARRVRGENGVPGRRHSTIRLKVNDTIAVAQRHVRAAPARRLLA
jgi:hypothetical protein